MIKLTEIKLIIFFILLFQLNSSVFAQEGQSSSSMNRGSQYFLGDRDEILMNVNVWGYVRNPGQYMVPRNTNLVSLISFAGGPREGANLGDVRIIREGHQTNGQNGTNGSAHSKPLPILDVDVKKHLQTGDPGLIPLLSAGDTIIIPESGGSKFQKFLGFNSFLSIIAATASVALIVERVSR